MPMPIAAPSKNRVRRSAHLKLVRCAQANPGPPSMEDDMKQQMTRMAALVALMLAASPMAVAVPVAAAAETTAKADDGKQAAKPGDAEASSDKKLGKKSKKACTVKGACSTEKGTAGK